MRGALNAPSNTPLNSPRPPTGTARAEPVTALMMAAITRSLSCQSPLVRWKGMRDSRPPQVVKPSKPMNVSADATSLGPAVIPSGVKA